MLRWMTFYSDSDQLRDPLWMMLVFTVWLGILALAIALASLALT